MTTRQATPARPRGRFGTITEFEGFNGRPAGLTLARDGNFWTTEEEDFLARLNLRTGEVTEFPLPPGTSPHAITSGPGGNLYFTSAVEDGGIGVFNLRTLTATLIPGITRGSYPHFILPGPDGNLYIAEPGKELDLPSDPPDQTPGRIARYNPRTGELVEFEGLPPGNHIHGLTFDNRGNLWGALEGTDQIARFNLTTETFDRLVDLPPESGPHQILFAPDGNLYITLAHRRSIGRYNPRTGAFRELVSGLPPTFAESPIDLTVGPGRRNLFFTLPSFFNEPPDDRIARLNLRTGQISLFGEGLTPGSNPIDIQNGPDGNIWFAELSLDPRVPGRIGRLNIRR